jgi:hypothetical protein
MNTKSKNYGGYLPKEMLHQKMQQSKDKSKDNDR